MGKELHSHEIERRNARVKRSWAKQAPRYDKSIGFFERKVFGTEHREWACSKASDDVLEVAVGTGLNLPLYPDGVSLTGIDLSPEMLTIARQRAESSGLAVDLKEGDAHHLPFEDGAFDTVLCTYSLCNIPDPRQALAEMTRVLRPGGKLVLVDHIRSSFKPILWFQKAVEFFTRRLEGEHMTRRPLEHVKRTGLDVTERERLGPGGIVERILAFKPGE